MKKVYLGNLHYTDRLRSPIPFGQIKTLGSIVTWYNRITLGGNIYNRGTILSEFRYI